MFYDDNDIKRKLYNNTLSECLSGADYEQGHLEDLEATNEKLKKSLGDLITLLHDKKIISCEEVINIVSKYGRVRSSQQ